MSLRCAKLVSAPATTLVAPENKMNAQEKMKVGSGGRVEKSLSFLVFGIPNILGLVLYLPLLFGVLMSFDAPGSGRHWIHWFFVVANLLLGPLCLIGLISRARRHWGLIGYALAVLGWALVEGVCGGSFTC